MASGGLAFGPDSRSHAPRGNAFRNALRHTAVLWRQVDWRSAQILVPTLRVVMPFVTLCVTQFCDSVR
ncbi:hypothetical protein ALQ09_00062, partial [Pseudomonas viridiflava]